LVSKKKTRPAQPPTAGTSARAVEGLEALQTRLVFDWDEEGLQNFISDPDVPAIFQEGSLQGRPQAAELGGEHDA
jgi:hypothetical protein